MKLHISFLTAALGAALGLSSCSDFLEEPVRGQENLDTYFSSETEADKYMAGCYKSITYGDWWEVNRMWLMSDMCTDDAWMGNTQQDASNYLTYAHFGGTGQENETTQCFWQYRYKGILNCNIAIENLPRVNFVTAGKQERYLGEARFLRAYFYFELVRNFGDVPVVEGMKTPDQIQGITRTPQAKVYDMIQQDLRYAVDVLPQRSQQGNEQVGHATRGAALGLLGKTMVYRQQWKQAADTLGLLISEGEYQLMPDFGQVWNMNFNNNAESLFEVQYMYDDKYSLGGILSVVTGNRSGGSMDGWAWCLPSANLEDAFVKAGDTQRLGYTIIRDRCNTIAGENSFADLVKDQGNLYGDGTYAVSPDKHKSGRLNRKFFIPFAQRPAKSNDARMPLNHRLLRYADVLLLHAEACNELGNDEQARQSLNLVRQRVSLPAVTASGDELRQAIRLERRLELAMENNRLYDIRRWRMADGHTMMAHLFGPNGSFVRWNTEPETRDDIEWANQREDSSKGKTFDESRDLLFPIPLYEISISNGTLVQNPGY